MSDEHSGTQPLNGPVSSLLSLMPQSRAAHVLKFGGKMKLVAKLTYMAVHSDNVQGASGKPFKAEEYFEIDGSSTVKDLLMLDIPKPSLYEWPLENIKILSLEIIKVNKAMGK